MGKGSRSSYIQAQIQPQAVLKDVEERAEAGRPAGPPPPSPKQVQTLPLPEEPHILTVLNSEDTGAPGNGNQLSLAVPPSRWTCPVCPPLPHTSPSHGPRSPPLFCRLHNIELYHSYSVNVCAFPCEPVPVSQGPREEGRRHFPVLPLPRVQAAPSPTSPAPYVPPHGKLRAPQALAFRLLPALKRQSWGAHRV